jgi:predicted ATP-grasp superfamily ATP-dependent carboligase
MGLFGKAIYFAPQRLIFPDSGPWKLTEPIDPWKVPRYADIPTAGSVIEKGQPVLTFFAKGTDESGVERQLQQIATELDQLFGYSATKN